MPSPAGGGCAPASQGAQAFFPAPSRSGIATGFDYPDALPAGAQLAQAGGPLLLVAADPPVPAPTLRYLGAHRSATATLYGGLAAVPSAAAASLLPAAPRRQPSAPSARSWATRASS